MPADCDWHGYVDRDGNLVRKGFLIRPGSHLYCPRCHLSGFEYRLAYQKAIGGTPGHSATKYRASELTQGKVQRVAAQVSLKCRSFHLQLQAARAVKASPTRRQRRSLIFGKGNPDAS